PRGTAAHVTTQAAANVTVSNLASTPPTVTGRTPAAGASGVPVTTTATATFSEAVTASTISFVLRDSANAVVPSAVSYDAATRTATLTPGSPLSSLSSYTATVSGAQDAAGNTMAAVSWSFTTAVVDTTAPTVTGQTPASGATNVATNSVATATFSEDVQA